MRNKHYLEYEYVEGLGEYWIPKNSGLADSRFLDISRIFVIIFVLIVVFVVGGTFLWASLKTGVDEIRWKARLIGLGFVVYGPTAAIDAFLAESVELIVLVRIVLVLSISCVYLGYAMPHWLRSRLNLPAV